MSRTVEKIVCSASWRDPISANFSRVSFSTVSVLFEKGPGVLVEGVSHRNPAISLEPALVAAIPQPRNWCSVNRACH
jgi:hypothetical protein